MAENTHFILLTDIAGSSRLSESHPQEYEALHAAHNAAVEAAIHGNGGSVLKGLGDGYLALFRDAAQCAACAVEIQRGIGASERFSDGTPLRLRIACHAGPLREAQTAAGTDYFGSALNNFGVRELLAGVDELAPAPRPQPADPQRSPPEKPRVAGLRRLLLTKLPQDLT